MKTEMQTTERREMQQAERRELGDAELNLVSGGWSWGGFAATIGAGTVGGLLQYNWNR